MKKVVISAVKTGYRFGWVWLVVKSKYCEFYIKKWKLEIGDKKLLSVQNSVALLTNYARVMIVWSIKYDMEKDQWQKITAKDH